MCTHKYETFLASARIADQPDHPEKKNCVSLAIFLQKSLQTTIINLVKINCLRIYNITINFLVIQIEYEQNCYILRKQVEVGLPYLSILCTMV